MSARQSDPAAAHAARESGATWAAAAVAGGYSTPRNAQVGVERWLKRGKVADVRQRPGRVPVSCRLPADLVAEMDAAAAVTGITRGEWLAGLVIRALRAE